MFLEFTIHHAHDFWMNNLVHFWSIAPHLWLDLMQLTPAIGHHLDDIVKCVAISALELNTYKFRVTVDAM